jgi:hypothetical protein
VTLLRDSDFQTPGALAAGVLDSSTKNTIRRLLHGVASSERRKDEAWATIIAERKERFIAGADAALLIWSRLMPSHETTEARQFRLNGVAQAAERLAKSLHALDQNDLSLLLWEHPRADDRDLAAVDEFRDWIDSSVSLTPILARHARAAATATKHVHYSKRGRKAFLIRQLVRTWLFVFHVPPGTTKTGIFFKVLAVMLKVVDEAVASEGKVKSAVAEMLDHRETAISDLVTWSYLAQLGSMSRSMRDTAQQLVLTWAEPTAPTGA